MSKIFETSLEKIGRIISRQYGIEVRCEGNQACTDGKVIVLPALKDVTPELKAELNGFLDHETAHIKFTEFPEMGKCLNDFHRNLLNAVEDERIEIEMTKEFLGAKDNLDTINNKYGPCQREARASGKLPAPHRIISSIRDVMANEIFGTEAFPVEEDIKEMIELLTPLAKQLKDCKSTSELRVVTEKITKYIDDSVKRGREKEKGEEGEEDKDGEEGEGKGKKGKMIEGEGDESKEGKALTSEEMSEILKETPYEDFMKEFNKTIEKAIRKDGKSNQKYLVTTTKFDKVIDYTKKGDTQRYASLKRKVKPVVASVRRQLERVLKVKENARWRMERERGQVSRKTLSKLAVNKNYKTPFQERTKADTNNVAIQILVDESGSMAGKMRTAQETVAAMAEALDALQIPFEVLGFNSFRSGDIKKYVADLEAANKGSTKRFFRKNEILEMGVYKSFDSNRLSGIECLRARMENPDGEAVRFAAKRLSERKEKRKILIVLSDGSPAFSDAYHRDDGRSILNRDLKETVKELPKYGIEVVGFGIQTNSVKEFYKDSLVINELSDLPLTTMKKLSKIITKGQR